MIDDVGDENSRNRHQHLKVVVNTFRLQHPPGIRIQDSAINIDVALFHLLNPSRDKRIFSFVQYWFSYPVS